MAVTAFWFAGALVQMADKEVDFLADTIKNALHPSTFTPNQDTMDYYDDVDGADELSTANGYTAGGLTVAGKANSNTNNVVMFDHENPVWTATGAGFTARRKTTFDSTPGSGATNPLLWWMDFGQDETASGGGTFTVAEHASGVALGTAADATGFP